MQMRQNPAKYLPVLELMYLCLSLGFMGRYRLSPRGPAEIDQSAGGTLRRHRQRCGRAPSAELSPPWQGVAAPYRPLRVRVPLWVAGSRRARRGGRAVRLVLDIG